MGRVFHSLIVSVEKVMLKTSMCMAIFENFLAVVPLF